MVKTQRSSESLRGLIVVTKTTEDDAGLPCALLHVGGITVLERQTRLLRSMGIREIDIIACDYDERLETAVQRLARLKVNVSLRSPWLVTAEALPGPREARWILMDGAALVDHRLPAILSRHDGNRIAVMKPNQAPAQDAAHLLCLETSGSPVAFAGCACLEPADVQHLCPQNGDHWLAERLSKLIQDKPETAVDVALLPTYLPDMRRDLPYYWMPIRHQHDNHRGKRLLLDASQKGVLDWPAWYLHRPIEKWIVYHICEWPITPNQITFITNLIAFWAVYHFAVGSVVGALLAALIVGILDGVDGKQARVKQMTSRIGKIEHVFDSICEYAWLMAMAYRLAREGHVATPYILCGIILAVNYAEKILLYVFERKRGVPLDDFTPFDRGFRAIVGRRNTYMWTLIPFVVADALSIGYWVLALYALMSLLVRVWRVRVNLARRPHRIKGQPKLWWQSL